MRLLELQNKFPLDIIRDGEFDSLGMINGRLEKMLVFAQDRKYLKPLNENESISCVIANSDLHPEIRSNIAVAITAKPQEVFLGIHEWLNKETSFYWKDFPTDIAQDVVVHPTAFVASQNVRIDHGTTIGPNVSILEKTLIGRDVVVEAGVTIGTKGFEFKRIGDAIIPVSHAGGVEIGDRVEIQANSAISRGLYSDRTTLGNDTKLDNLVHIAHGAKVGERCLIAASAMVAGSVVIGNDVWIGPGARISNGVKICDRVKVSLGSVVINDVDVGERVSGNFAVPHKNFAKFMAAIRRGSFGSSR